MKKDFPLGAKLMNDIPADQAQAVKAETLHWIGQAATLVRQDKIKALILSVSDDEDTPHGAHSMMLGEPAECWLQLQVMVRKLEQAVGGEQALTKLVAAYIKDQVGKP